MNLPLSRLVIVLSAVHASTTAFAHGGDGMSTAPDTQVLSAFDIVHTRITTDGNQAVFHAAVSGEAGAAKPAATGQLGGSGVYAYVWPTTLDPATVGFESGAGILAFTVTAHPDFDDTPLFDEDADGDTANDGNRWHSHWVVLKPAPDCGPDALKVVDIPDGTTPRLPKTWPGLPILIDSPGWSPVFSGDTLEVRVPFDDIGVLQDAGFDGVTAALRVHESVHSPLLCVVDVFKIASGDLSLPGEVAP